MCNRIRRDSPSPWLSRRQGAQPLLLLLFLLTFFTTLGSLHLLAADTARATTTEWRGKGEVDVLLGVETDHEGWDVDDLLANTVHEILASLISKRGGLSFIPDVSLLDEDTGVVDRLGKAESVDAGLETALQEVLDLEGKDVIESKAGLVEDTNTDKTANQGVTLKKTLGVLLVESEELTVKSIR